MPQWIHDRAMKLKRKMEDTYGPDKAKQVAFAVATQQAHATGKSPKTFVSKQTGHKERFGTPGGRAEARAKMDKPKSEYKKTASAIMFRGFADELVKICADVPGLAQKLEAAKNVASSALSKAEAALARPKVKSIIMPKVDPRAQLARMKAERELARLKEVHGLAKASSLQEGEEKIAVAKWRTVARAGGEGLKRLEEAGLELAGRRGMSMPRAAVRRPGFVELAQYYPGKRELFKGDVTHRYDHIRGYTPGSLQ